MINVLLTNFYLLLCSYQSGFQPPTDIPFEDLSKMESSNSTQSPYGGIGTLSSMSIHAKGTLIGGKYKKRAGLLNSIFGSNKVSESRCQLPPPLHPTMPMVLVPVLVLVYSQLSQRSCNLFSLSGYLSFYLPIYLYPIPLPGTVYPVC